MDNLLEDEHKKFRVFPVPYKHVAIEFIVDRGNNVLGEDIDGSNYVGKIGNDLQVSLVELTKEKNIKCFNGILDLNNRILVGKWLDDSYLNDVISRMQSFSDESLFDSLPDDSLEISNRHLLDEGLKIKMKSLLRASNK